MRTLILLCFALLNFGGYAQGDIYLSLPTDGELIEDESINFIWQVSSLGSQEDPRLSQELIVSEMKVDQTAFEAIEVNPPILTKSNIRGATFFVSSSNFPFKEGKKYAWQIRYYLNGVLISRSEAWWFEMKKPEPKFLSYYPMRKKQDGQKLLLDEDELRVSLISKGDLDLSIVIVTSDGERLSGKLVEMDGKEPLKEGLKVRNNNRNFKLDLSELKLKKGEYTFEWTPKKTEFYMLNFELL